MELDLIALSGWVIASGAAGGLATRLWDLFSQSRLRKWQIEDEQNRWSRDERLKAYVAFSFSVHAFTDAVLVASRNLRINPNPSEADRIRLQQLRGECMGALTPIGLIAPDEVFREAHNFAFATTVFMSNLPVDEHQGEKAGTQLGLHSSLWRLAANRDLRGEEIAESFTTEQTETSCLWS